MRKKGLVGGHCYALISAHMENIKGRRVRLIKLRNPWGKFGNNFIINYNILFILFVFNYRMERSL